MVLDRRCYVATGHLSDVHCVLKKIPNIFSCNLSKHDLIYIIFGIIVTERLVSQKLFYFLPSRE